MIYVYVIARAGVIFGSGYISRVVGIAAVKSHEAKLSAISPLTENEWNISQNFTTARAITLIPWLLTLLFPLYSRLHNGGAI